MKLPKLYRKVYLKFEWCIDTCHFGEHHQDSGFYYVPAMRVLEAKGGWFWRITDWVELDEGDKKYFDKYNHHEEDGWSEVDLIRFDDDGEVISWYYPYNTPTIKEQKEQRKPAKEIVNTGIDWDRDIPF